MVEQTSAEARPVLLEVSGLGKEFGGLKAVHDLSLTVRDGEVHGLIGPNGAGKSTVFGLLGGAISASAGTVRFRGEEILGRRPSAICRAGLARTHQIMRPLPGLTVLENVMVGAYCRTRRRADARDRAQEALEFTGLAAKAHHLASSLTLAERKRLEITRALATQPRLLLLDEVMSGLTPTETEEAVELVRAIQSRGTSLIVIEHVMRVVMALSDQVTVLNHGEELASGRPDDVVGDPAVIAAYLGGSVA